MKLKLLSGEYVICKAADFSQLDKQAEFLFLAKTDEEYSIVCQPRHVPPNHLEIEPGWHAFRIQGKLDFSLIGILAEISTVLAAHDIGIFVLSTYNTDYILVKAENLQRAIAALEHAGYTFDHT